MLADGIDEDDLLRRAKAGDEGALGALVERSACYIEPRARRLVGAQHAEEVTQEALFRTIRSLKIIRTKFSAVATRNYRNVVVEHYRSLKYHKKHRVDGFDVSQLESRKDAKKPEESGEVKNAILQALSQLPPNQRLVIVFRYWENMSLGEITEVLGFPMWKVKELSSEAMKILGERLKGMGGDHV